MNALLLANACSTLFMTGLIWFVQIVHYPLFAVVGTEGFTAYSRAHQRATTAVVGLPMLVEALTSVLLVLNRSPLISPLLAWVGLVLVVITWISTAALQIPAHRRLTHGFDAAATKTLVSTNWIRTAAWTAHSGVVIAMIVQALAPVNS
ncbi:MAG: hypothetical protein DWI17_00910 [Planctomycetota bacterium]|nr:MAG: hypothetical protein DWI17_00910 [Planctomycetota bacterium]